MRRAPAAPAAPRLDAQDSELVRKVSSLARLVEIALDRLAALSRRAAASPSLYGSEAEMKRFSAELAKVARAAQLAILVQARVGAEAAAGRGPRASGAPALAGAAARHPAFNSRLIGPPTDPS